MEKQVKAPKEIRQRKFLLVLPLLALPFMTMIFWSLGGGKVQKVEAQAAVKKGFNINLPDANLKDDKPMDKMSYYNQAQLDSVKFRELMKNDPNYKNIGLTDTDGYVAGQEDSFPIPAYKRGLNTSLYGNQGHNDPKTDKIYSKLAELDKEMNKPITKTAEDEYNDMYQNAPRRSGNGTTVNSSDVDRLEQMMNTMNQSNGEDPEMKQLNGMLDKVLDVQYPERVQERLKQASEAHRGQVFAVSSQKADNNITLLDNDHITGGTTTNGFYSLTETTAVADSQNAIQAVIHETQTLVDGSTVKLRLLNDVFINGVHIPKDNFLFGIASLRGERLNVKITSIRYNNSIFPVDLAVYDMDGLDGIYIPGAITRDVAKQSADRSMQTLGLTSLDPSWQAQAAGAGIEAAKTLFSRKVKLIKVQVKAGYKVLLRDEKQKQSN
ncbi:Bacteroides conjugative transposon TraM protein [Hydrobacter penzbergensis]|uniref:Bacteroides conjugative transposon TraM protein n=1 Tax=Hydrobacter penzbergensis TaxID=1235997 RepID=A0A8X8IDG3_9BACT|nr:conjugative transposon protein TraM [Hydrobacter penzbergensis]SDW50475.1 Bacteroides conjugative transposon TraM protein [Hydrobacter penzbergensis]